MIPYGRQDINQEDIDSVVSILKSDFLTQGPAIPAFEKSISEYCGVPHVVALSSATAGLHIACLALGLGRGDIAWTSPNTFPASANAALLCGADVDFVDIDPQTYNMCPKALRSKLDQAKKNGRLPKIVIPVHFAGQSCDMAAIATLAHEYGFKIIEDASHCIGAQYKGKKIGSCDYSDFCVFSFHPVKIITTGEGGAVTTRNPDLYKRLVLLRSHGITREESMFEGKSHGAWYYEQLGLSTNYRMTDMQAALGRSQLSRLDQFITRRREIAARYDALFSDFDSMRPHQIPEAESSWHLYVVQVPQGISRKDVFDKMRQADIGVNVHYIPVHTHPYFRNIGFIQGDFPLAEAYYESAITLPLYPGLTDQDQDYVVSHLISAINS